MIDQIVDLLAGARDVVAAAHVDMPVAKPTTDDPPFLLGEWVLLNGREF
jgi:hypothetical protein